MAFLFMCIFILFLCYFLSLILNKYLLAKIQENIINFCHIGSNHSEVIIKYDILLMFRVFESCILK